MAGEGLNTFAAPFPPHFPVKPLLSYLSEDIFSFAFSSLPPLLCQAFERKHVSMAEQSEPLHETFCYGQKGWEI